DQLPTGDRYFPTKSKRIEDQEHCGSVVIDHRGRLGAGELTEQTRNMVVAVAATARTEVEFQGSGRRECFGGGRCCFRRKGRTAEICMKNRPSQVEHGPLGRRETTDERVSGGIQNGGGGSWKFACLSPSGQFRLKRGLRGGATEAGQ